jgi:hypothetical protein
MMGVKRSGSWYQMAASPLPILLLDGTPLGSSFHLNNSSLSRVAGPLALRGTLWKIRISYFFAETLDMFAQAASKAGNKELVETAVLSIA